MKSINLRPKWRRLLRLAAAVLIALSLSSARMSLADDQVPVPWNGMDIGGPAPAGGSHAGDGTFTVTAGGAGLAGASDQFHFVYQAVTGDFALAGRVTFPSGPDGASEAGLMVRDALAATSNFVAIARTSGRGILLQYRTPFVPHVGADAAGASGLAWIRLVKRGTTVAGYRAADVNNAPGVWKKVGGDQPIASGMVYVGLCLTSSAPGTGCQAAFDHISLTLGPPLLDDGTYTIAPVGTPGMVLATAVDDVHLEPAGESAARKWRLTNKGGGFYSCQPLSNLSLALSVPGAKSDPGSRVAVVADWGQDTQRWSVVAQSNGTYSLLPQFNTGIGLDDFGGNGTPGAVIDIWSYNSADPHMQWTITPAQ